MFGTILILVCTFMHIYVFWRIDSVPFIRRHLSRKILIVIGLILWIVFYCGRVFGHGANGAMAAILEFAGMNWMAVLFLILIPIFAVDIGTLFGFIMRRVSPVLRGWAIALGVILSVVALFQGMRPPVIQEYEVVLPNLPEGMDGTVIVALSDLHIGSLLGEDWLTDRIEQVREQQPDLVVLLGDTFEGHEPPASNIISKINSFSAPLNVWAVNGNHELHGRKKIDPLGQTELNVLRNSWKEIRPGLVVAGVDDLTVLKRSGKISDPVSTALKGIPPGSVTVFLSHSPLLMEKAAAAGVNLMLCGHTHGGQIWPFDYLVGLRYPLLEGRYKVKAMTVIVCRGTGTWGPRMRLWAPGEILRITLRRTSGEI